MSESKKLVMSSNIRIMLGEMGYEPYHGPTGMIDYDVIETGKKLKRLGFDELMFYNRCDDNQVWIYTFSSDGFVLTRWVKK